MPFFSIIVVSLNAEKYIKDTVQSVLDQTCSDYEIIVKDGMSKDKTLEVVPLSDKIKFIQKSDSGVYDAMNQAIVEAKGKYLCFLNCGDTFASIRVLEEMKFFIGNNDNSTEAVYYGNYETGGMFSQSPCKTTRYSIYRNPLCHQTMFIPCELFEKYGLYRADFKILADYEFTVHCVSDNIPCINSGILVCKYMGGGLSTQKKYKKRSLDEYKWVRRKYFTVVERIVFRVKIMCTLPHLRAVISSPKSPFRFVYRKLANAYKRKG